MPPRGVNRQQQLVGMELAADMVRGVLPALIPGAGMAFAASPPPAAVAAVPEIIEKAKRGRSHGRDRGRRDRSRSRSRGRRDRSQDRSRRDRSDRGRRDRSKDRGRRGRSEDCGRRGRDNHRGRRDRSRGCQDRRRRRQGSDSCSSKHADDQDEAFYSDAGRYQMLVNQVNL